MNATLNSRNQITIPKAVRDYLHLKPGDKLKFFFQPDGAVVILPTVAVSKLKGIVPQLDPPVSIEQIGAAIEAGATEKFRG